MWITLDDMYLCYVERRKADNAPDCVMSEPLIVDSPLLCSCGPCKEFAQVYGGGQIFDSISTQNNTIELPERWLEMIMERVR